ncbi:MAG: hypothetical protein CSB55_05110 [Candidatus Cloacimonadota bacterium]|nr:MAG: hypothetical protein CSB55_05110 [Candidatus Cloacimonadota bacterium]
MGQQQILLIVLTIILVGIAVSVGITMFRDQTLQSNKDAIIADLTTLAQRAYQYRIKPESMGGGGGDYDDLELTDLGSAEMTNNANAQYVLTSAAADEVVITATGKIGATPWTITCTTDGAGKNTIDITTQASF